MVATTKSARRQWTAVLLFLAVALGLMAFVVGPELFGNEQRRVRGAESHAGSLSVGQTDRDKPAAAKKIEASAEPELADTPEPDPLPPLGDPNLPREESIRGRVTDADGKPVADAIVVAAHKDVRARPYIYVLASRVRTDEAGLFVVGPLERENFVLLASKEQSVGFAIGQRPGAWVDLVLGPGVGLSGRITSRTSSQPLAGATVLLRDSGFELRAETDKDGRYKLGPLPPTRNTWQGSQLVVTADMHLRAERNNLILKPGAAAAIDFELDGGATLAGRVIDAQTKQPLKGATVGEGWETFHRRTTVGADGGYVLGHIDTRPNETFSAQAPGYVPQARQSDGSGELVFELDRAQVVRGTVFDRAGTKPVSGARVYLHRVRYAKGYSATGVSSSRVLSSSFVRYGGGNRRRVTSGADGTFVFEDVLPGKVAIIAFNDKFAPAESEVVDVPEGVSPPAVKVMMREGLTVVGEVRDKDEKPLRGILVRMQNNGQVKGYKYARNYVWQEMPVWYTDEQGRFELKGAVPGKHYLTAWDQTYGWASRQIEGQEGQKVDDVIISFAGAAIQGKLLSAGGEPIPFAYVNAQGPQGGQRRRWRSTQTDGLGRFHLAGLAEGNYHLNAWVQGQQADQLKDIPAGTTGVELKLKEMRFLRGVVRSELTGGVVERYRLSIQPQRRKGEKRRGSSWSGAIRAPDGRFERSVLPGRYVVIAKADGHAPGILESVIVEEGLDPQPIEVVMSDGGGVEGRLLDPENKPVERANVSVQLEQVVGQPADPLRWHKGGNDRTDRLGRYFVDGLAPGIYTVQVNLGRRGSAVAKVTVPARGRARQELKLLPTGKLSIKVVGEDDKPIKGVWFQIKDDNGGWIGWAQQSNGQGISLSQPLRMGPANVIPQHNDYEGDSVAVTIISDKTTAIEIRMRKKQK